MKKSRILIAFISCWLISSVALYLLNILWPTTDGMPVKNLMINTFFMSVVIIAIFLAIWSKK